ncbi:Gfo/Idh/MocA family oxidoreductase [Halobaculum sp. MBLA0143]|uniref:Gfo/Idh/MocA family oxidoreductase n=1 Tax=Halobaculum sp. MBLA0143 TaxID=3079933 RepID=UPI0035267616
MNCLFVGAGAAAEAYATGLSATRLSLSAVCDLDADRAERLAAETDAAAYTDVDTMLAAESAPLVVVLTSHAAHAAVTRTALAADRHVFCQKPLALSPDDAWSLVELARDRGLALGCAPVSPRHPAQRRVGELLADGRLGPVRLGYVHAHVGRVTEWHDSPDSFLDVGPLYDGAVYPLTLLTAWFGRVDRVRTADASDPWPDDRRTPSAPTHVEATLSFADGPLVRLTTSLYAPHRSREFSSLELHGDGGSLYLGDCGAGTDDPETVQFGREGRAYTAVPPTAPSREGGFADGPARLAARVGDGARPVSTAVRAAHVVTVADAVDRAATTGDAVPVPDPPTDAPFALDRPPAPCYGATPPATPPDAGVRLPRVGVAPQPDAGADTVETAVDAGCRLFVVDGDTAETVGAALSGRGAPDPATVHVAAVVDDPDADVDRVRSALGRAADSLLLRVDAVDPPARPAVWRGLTDRAPVVGVAGSAPELAETAVGVDNPALVVADDTPVTHSSVTRALTHVDDATAVSDEIDAGRVPVSTASDPERVVTHLAAAGGVS